MTFTSDARQPEVALFLLWTMVFSQIFNQIVSIRVKKLSNTNFISSRHIKREKSSLPLEVRRSKTSLLKLPNTFYFECFKKARMHSLHKIKFKRKIWTFSELHPF